MGYLIATSSMAMNCDKEAININPDIIDRLAQANMVAPPPMPPDMMVDFDFQPGPSAAVPPKTMVQPELIDLVDEGPSTSEARVEPAAKKRRIEEVVLDEAGPSGAGAEVEPAGAMAGLPIPPEQQALWTQLMEKADKKGDTLLTEYSVARGMEGERDFKTNPRIRRALEVAQHSLDNKYTIKEKFGFSSQRQFLVAIGFRNRIRLNPIHSKWEKVVTTRWK